ncbi:unnamed protein product [Caenorhabditis auriculariae]|uniref:Cell cycle control protein 50A n=1 Tax=Caenorhabditis auriculariae TaxID=2777116 RepID=A0A8S1H6R7_9PELO|nr:unnamed protein product [Caenorhabditis auriculariae]
MLKALKYIAAAIMVPSRLPGYSTRHRQGVMPPREPQPSSTAQIANGDNRTEEKPLKNRPKASNLRQQKLPAWQPILTASTVIPTVIAVGIVFIPIGIALFIASDSVEEKRIDYTDCNSVCSITFQLDEDYTGDVYLYYYLENFYQNHRRYVKSRSDRQYLGNLNEVGDCDPFDKDKATGLPIAPCGAIANSIFNDTFEIYYTPPNMIEQRVPTTVDGVLWDVDNDRKFKNPPIPEGKKLSVMLFAGTVPPPNWKIRPCENGGFKNVDFIVWMRTAALPNFRKLWRLVSRTDSFTNGLPRGQYRLKIDNNYPVKSFGGRKEFIISTTSWAGGKNNFLGIAYLVVGSLAIVLGVVFIIIHIKFGHSMNELSNVSAGHH